MTIREWSIQILQKSGENASSQLKMPAKPAKGDADTESLCQTLKRVFMSKPGKAYGYLKMHLEQPVCGPWIKQWQERKIPFAEMAHHAMLAVKERIDALPMVTHCYCLWVCEQQGELSYLYAFMVESSITQVVNADFIIEPIEHLDPQGLSFAIRIDLTRLFSKDGLSGDDLAIVFLQRQQRKLADAVCQGFGFTSSINTTEETETMMKGIEHYASTLGEPEAKVFKKRAIEFCKEQDNFGEPVAIADLSKATDDDNPESFASFFRNQLPEASANLHPDSRKLKQLVKFAGRSQTLSLSFSSEAINQSIIYNVEEGTLTIKEVPKSLKMRLRQYLEQTNPNEEPPK